MHLSNLQSAGKRKTYMIAEALGACLLFACLALVPVETAAAASDHETRAQDSPSVISALTTKTTQVVKNPDGTFTATIAAGPVRVPSDSSPTGWTPIDTDLNVFPGGIRPAATDANVTFSAGGDDPAASLALGNKVLEMEWPQPLPEPTVMGDTATYNDVQPGMDLALRATPSGFETSFVLDGPPDQDLQLQIPLNLTRVHASLAPDGQFRLEDSNGDMVVSADQAQMWDSSTDASSGDPSHQASVETHLVNTPSGRALELDPDSSFLTDPSITYPVTIDPTPDLTVARDTDVESATPGDTFTNSTNLKSGTTSGSQTARSLIKFNTASVTGTHILDATLNLYENYSPSCTASEVDLKRVDSTWSGPTWNTQPTYGPVYSSASYAKGFSSSCPADWIQLSDGGASGRTLAGLVQGWADGSLDNEGLSLKGGNESNTNSWKKFNSSDNSSNPPTLTVDFNSYPKVPQGLAPVSTSYVGTTQPTLHGRFCDPDGGQGRVDFDVRNNATGSDVVASSTSRAMVQSCVADPWSVPSGNLVDGTTYKWRATGDDGTDVSAWSSYRTFTVDTAAPSAPTITSTSHSSQTTWYSSSNTSFSASWTASSDSTSGVAGYAVAFDQDPSYTPTDITQTTRTFSTTISGTGVWYLHVAAQDSAGNWGSAASYQVHIGAAMTSPFDGDETQKYVTLQGMGDPSKSTAILQYRESPNDSAGWRTVPAGDVSTTSGGSVSWPVSLDSAGATPKLVWNVASTLSNVDGPVQVRVQVGSSSPDSSDPLNLALDQNILGTAQDLGPGSVDLITGNFTLSAGDANFGRLAVTRTLNSRAPDGQTSGIFGSGWESGLETAAGYSALSEDTSAGTVTITAIDGSLVFFDQKPDGSWTPSAGTDPSMELAKASGQFTLTESDGTQTIFSKPSGASDYVPSQVSTPGSNTAVTTSYQVVSGVAQPTQILDVVPSGVSCGSSLVKGCRALTLTYASSTTASGTSSSQWGDYAGQVKTVSFTAWNPSSSQMVTTSVASYLYDSNGRLRGTWDPRMSPALKTTYDYDSSGHVTSLTPPGQSAWTITYGTITDDSNTGRVISVSRPATTSGTETTTVVYGVPVSGSGAPYSMGASAVAQWDQQDFPTDATAIFPPGHEPSESPPSDYDWANVHYLDRNGMEVNTAQSDGGGGGYIWTTEYDESGNDIRDLSAQARATAMASSDPQGTAALLDDQSVYSSDGTTLTDTYGPQHPVELATDSQVLAREHTHYVYDQGAPSGGPYYLPTTVTDGALVAGATSDTDVQTTKYEYDWTQLQRTKSIVDPDGIDLVTTSAYDSTTGQVSKTILPANPSGGDAHETDSFYYTGGTGSGVAACNNHPEWSGQLCETAPAAQPTSGDNLPVVTYTYDLWGDTSSKTESVSSPSATRTTTYTYDGAGRLQGLSTSGPGTSVPDVTYGYGSSSGLRTTTSAGSMTITHHYDALGRMDSYVDADGNTSTFGYDLQDRQVSVDDGKGAYSLTYDGGSELVTSETDSQAGTFTASYDANGNLTSRTFPNGMTATISYDETDSPTSITYVKTSNCSSGCTWYTDQVTPDVHGQRLGQDTSLSSQQYTYDAAGRLTWTYDTTWQVAPNSTQCVTREYGYDADSNRTSLTTRDPNPDTGACVTSGSGTTASSTYDQADRATGSGYSFDALGRMTDVPAADANGNALSATFYANDESRALTSGGVTHTSYLDPTARTRQVTTSASSADTQTEHYSCDCDAPAWIAENTSGSSWTRDISGVDGQLIATADQSDVVLLQVTDLQGDVVATASSSPTASGLVSSADQTEFGVPRQGGGGLYGWLGGSERASDSLTGTIAMDARTYLPTVGRFLQPDPMLAGSDNDYALAVETKYPPATYCTAYPGYETKNGNFVAGGYIECNGSAPKVHIYADIQRYNPTAFKWVRIQRTGSNCFNYEPTEWCRGYTSKPLHTMKRGTDYDAHVTGWWVNKRGGTVHTAQPGRSLPYICCDVS